MTPARFATPRRYLMCPPTFFDVTYSINPWMNPDVATDTALAMTQWQVLADTYRSLGHTVDLIEPAEGFPDMIFAANGGLIIDGRAMGAKFRNVERIGEGPLYQTWLAEHCTAAVVPTQINEGEGDYLVVGDLILGGTGFRTEPESRREVQEFFGRPVVQLELVDPRYYHLDTAISILSDTEIAYLPAAFSSGSQLVLQRLFPDAIHVSDEDASVLGLNAVSDGLHVVVAAQAHRFHHQLAERGFLVTPVDVSELGKSGGGIKCCTLEFRSADHH